METKRFLQSVLAREGWYCVLAIHSETGRRKQKFYDSIDHLMAQKSFLTKLPRCKSCAVSAR
jgi:hypothetical protein